MKKLLLYSCLVTAMLSSCAYGRFMETDEDPNPAILLAQNPDVHVLRVDDKITVSVWDHNDVSLGSIFSIYSVSESFGKWVLIDSLGNAMLPKLGSIHLKGMTCLEAGSTIAEMLQSDLVDPIVVVKVINKEVTVLGEVKTPGNYLIDKEHNTITELIGKAEGFLQYAKTNKVQLIRNDIVYTIDLSVHSAYSTLNVKADDVIFIPAKKAKSFDLSIQRIIPFASAVTAVAIFITLFN